VDVRVAAAVVLVEVNVVHPAPPAHEQPHGERHDDDADRCLGALLCALRQVGLEEHDRQAEDEERRRVAEPPGEAESPGAASPSFLVRRDQRADRREVVGVGRVAQAQEHRNDDDHEQRRSVRERGHPVVESEH
jgi:hypothetical protein